MHLLKKWVLKRGLKVLESASVLKCEKEFLILLMYQFLKCVSMYIIH